MYVTEILLVASPLACTAPPFPKDAVHEVNVVLDSSVPVIESVFPSPNDPQTTAPLEYVDEESEREMFSNEHDLMVTSAELSNLMSGLDTVSRFEGVRVTFVRLSFPDVTEKREYPSEDSDGVNAMEDSLRSDPAQMKRKSVNETDELKGLATTVSPSGLILTIP